MSRTVQIDEEIGRPELEWERKALEEVRTKLRGRHAGKGDSRTAPPGTAPPRCDPPKKSS